MAAWQCDFEIGFSDRWPIDYRARLDQIAAPGPSWRAGLETWGVDDGNRIDVNSIDGRSSDGLLRIDVRHLDLAFIQGVLNLLEAFNCSLRDVAGASVEPNLGDVMLAVRRSGAFRFVSDPEDYLRRLERGGLSDA